MKPMRLYAFHCGFERFANAILNPFHKDPAGRTEVPYFFYLITHPVGNVMFDAGPHPGLVSNLKGHLGEEAENWGIDVSEEDLAAAKLAKLGLGTEDIAHVVISHLHYDHLGAANTFTKAKVHVQKADWAFVKRDPLYQKSLFVATELQFAEGQLVLHDGRYDLFGDGRLVLVPSPGHTPGHQSLEVKLNSGTHVLVGDAIYSPDTLDNIGALPAGNLVWSADAMVETHLALRDQREKQGVKVLCTHDTEFRTRVRLAPEAWYE